MRIAQVAPLYESVPPKGYGGTERVVAFLTDALVQAGHDVTLFATADSHTRGTLVPCAPEALRLSERIAPQAYHLLELEHVFQRASQFDVIHFHLDTLHFPLSRRSTVPCVTTLHGRLDIPELVLLYREFDDQPLVSISNAQRAPLAWAQWEATVYHGLPSRLFTAGSGKRGYLTFLGRISPEKRVDRAIEIARRWPELFGMVLIEALACGTPVVAFAEGSVPEVIDDGVTGYVVDSMERPWRPLRALTYGHAACCRSPLSQLVHARSSA